MLVFLKVLRTYEMNDPWGNLERKSRGFKLTTVPSHENVLKRSSFEIGLRLFCIWYKDITLERYGRQKE